MDNRTFKVAGTSTDPKGDSLWATQRSRCEWGGLAVSLGLILVVSRVTGYFGRPCPVGV